MSDRVQIEITNGVADVRLNRPDKMNALDPAMFRGLVEAGTALANESSLRAVVLSGEGRAFCAGLDFASFQAMAGGSDDAPAASDSDAAAETGTIGLMSGRITHLAQQSAWTWRELPVPVIGAIHGVALGGGCQIALGTDIRFTTAEAKFSVLEIKWGLIPDMTGTVTLQRLVGLDVAKELTFTGRMVQGEEAVRIGLATHVAEDPHAAAMELANEIASKSPHAVRAAKRLFDEVEGRSIAEQLAAERHEIGQLIGSPNQIEAVMAGMQKRDASYADPE